LDWEIQDVFSAENAVPEGTGGSPVSQHQFPQKNTSYCGSRTAPSPTHCGKPWPGNPAVGPEKWTANPFRFEPQRCEVREARIPVTASSRPRLISSILFPKKNASAPATKRGWSACERIAPPLPSRRMLRSPIGYGRETWGGARSSNEGMT